MSMLKSTRTGANRCDRVFTDCGGPLPPRLAADITWRVRRLVHWPGRCCVRELPDGVGNPAPGSRPIVILVDRELVGTLGALLERLFTIAFEHQVGGAPDIDLGYHATKSAPLRSRNV